MMMPGLLVTVRASEFWISCRRCILVPSSLPSATMRKLL